MKKIILFGATGNLGKEIAKEAVHRGYNLTVVIRNKNKSSLFHNITNNIIVADVSQPGQLTGICNNQDIVISALGKSVSLNDKSRPGFIDVDFKANKNILEEALKSSISKFIYVSAFHAEQYQHLTYFKVHHDFAELLKQSGIDYSIIKPPAIFSAFLDLFDMARKGQLVTMGKGDKKTNPIYEGDLAKVCLDAINSSNSNIEAGGKHVYTRRQINEIIQQHVAPSKKVRSIPMGLVKTLLPVIRLYSRNMHDKTAFFAAVMQEDLLAPLIGEMSLEEYVKMKLVK